MRGPHESGFSAFFLALFALLAFAGCDAERVDGERVPLAPAVDELGRGVFDGAESDSDVLLWLEPAVGETPASILDELGLTELLVETAGPLARLQGAALELLSFLADARILGVQRNHPVTLSAPADLTMAFFEGDVNPTDVLVRPEFEALGLERVHARARGNGVRVAILDTGLDPAHSLFQGRVELVQVDALRAVEESANGIDDDGDGRVDEAFGHGSHVAGIVATVAPGATLVPLSVLSDDGVGTAFELAVALQTAIELEVDVINLSLSIHEDSSVIRELLRRARDEGIAVVAAGGNTGGEITYPAAYAAATGAGATVVDMTRLADFSARGSTLEFAAPGTEVLSAYPGDRWALASGSSMASGVLAGAVAVVASSSLRLGAQDAELSLARVAVPIDPEGSVMHGRVDLLAALGDATRGRTKRDWRAN